MRKLPPLAELRAFEAAARHLSFKAAAEELGVTPTAISHQIRLLEEYCGRRLFRRRPRPVSLTKDGEKLFPVIRDGLDEFAGALSSLRRPGEVSTLKVTTTNAFASKWLVPRLSRWHAIEPGVTLEVTGTDAVLDLAGGEVDVAIRYMYEAPAGYQCHELFRDKFVAVCSPRILPDGKALSTLSDLAAFVLVHAYWSPADPNAPTWQRWLAAASKTVPGHFDLEAAQHLSFREELHAIDAVRNDQGILVISDLLVARELAQGELVRALDFEMPGYGFYLTYLPDHPDHELIDAFARWTRSTP